MGNKKDIEILSKEKLVLLGFGAQGEAEAINLRKSGIPFVLGLRKEGASFQKAKEQGFEVSSMEEAIFKAEVVGMNLPDHVQADVYQKYLQRGPCKRLVFAHGFNTHFKRIPVLETGPEHILVAPKGAASGLKEFYGSSHALPAILAIEKTKKTISLEGSKQWAESYARAMGCHSQGLVWASFKDETECDLFSEQVLLCGGVSSLLRRCYEVMVEAGYHPEAAYFESLFELKLIVDLIWQRGITGMREKISPTARYGDITRGDRMMDETIKEKMKTILKEIQLGKFAEEFLKNHESAEFKQKEMEQKDHPLETMGKVLREKMKIRKK